MSSRQYVDHSFRYFVVLILAVLSLAPLVIFFFSALKSPSELGTNPLGFPHHWRWGNFADAWNTARFGPKMRNSLIIVAGTVAGVCLISGCAAYAMARLDLPGGNAVMVYLIVTSALPIQLFLVPLFYMWAKLHLYDTLIGIIIIYWAIFSPFATLLLRSFMMNIPREIEEAARLDGTGELGLLARIVVPVSLPGFLTIALTTALAAYNEFLLAVTFIQSDEYLPASTGYFAFQQGFTQNYALVAAAGLTMMAPALIAFLLLQRRFVEGISATGIGGA